MDRYSPDKIGARYNAIADAYEQKRSLTFGLDYVQRFLKLLPFQLGKYKTQTILDIGCGTGIPLTRHLVSSGAKVIGVDISGKMVEKARINVPNAFFVEGDITRIQMERKVDGILAWDSLFHLSFEEQEKVIRKVVGWLKLGGVFLFTTGGQAGELVSEMFGTDFYYSSLSVDSYERILINENCQVIINEIDDPSSHGHRVICCRKLEN